MPRFDQQAQVLSGEPLVLVVVVLVVDVVSMVVVRVFEVDGELETLGVFGSNSSATKLTGVTIGRLSRAHLRAGHEILTRRNIVDDDRRRLVAVGSREVNGRGRGVLGAQRNGDQMRVDYIVDHGQLVQVGIVLVEHEHALLPPLARVECERCD